MTGRPPVLHDLKAWPDAFAALWSNSKHHEIRRADREFVEGDLARIREWLPDRQAYTGRWVRGLVGHVSHAGAHGSNARLPEGLAVFTFIEMSRGIDGGAL